MSIAKIVKTRDDVLKLLKGKVGPFYLAGGTALSLFYFKHRESYDLDFFAKDFSRKRAEDIIELIKGSFGIPVELVEQKFSKDMAKIMVYYAKIDKNTSLKIDFVEDFFPLIEEVASFNEIPVMSIPDIYIRKIYACCGTFEMISESGKKVFTGGRQESKDFFDLYFLSQTFMPLSKFVHKYGDASIKERLIIWYRKYDRFHMKSGLLEIITDKVVNYNEMERHFKSEIERMIEEDII
ncbi:MAG: nucleotidyl transferase AbiEii/AbiGii toxin family protein [Candidatus Omnitrophota bacterium]